MKRWTSGFDRSALHFSPWHPAPLDAVLLVVLLIMAVPTAHGAVPATGGQAASIPLAELGSRADAQQAPPAPVLDGDRAILAAPLQALRGELSPAGLTVESTSASEGGGRFRLTPVSLSKGAAAIDLPPGAVRLRERAVVLERGPLAEILTASGNGMRQDFVVAQPPAGDAPLTLTLALEGATAHTVTNGVGLTLSGGRELVYHGLHITDASGRVLAGTLTARDARTLAITVADAGARYPLTIDPTIADADWSALHGGLDGPVWALAVSGSELYVGGEFGSTSVYATPFNGIAKWDGSGWSALGSGLDLGGQPGWVYALAVSGSNLYVGGDFTHAGVTAANYIAKWTLGATDDTGWSALGSGTNSVVRALAASGSDLYVGGYFSSAGGVTGTTNAIAKWTLGATDDTGWSAVGGGLESTVWTLAVSGANLYVGGDFTTSFGGAANALKYIAEWNGSAWSALGSGLNGPAYALALSGDDLYVGGGFTSAGGVSGGNCIAKWNTSSTAWSALGSGLNGCTWVNALAVSGGALYVGGAFTTAGTTTVNNIAAWTLGATDNTGWSALGSGTNADINALAVSGNDLYVGGDFTFAGGNSAYVAKVDLPPCGFGIPYTTTNQWLMLALPCAPSASPPTVAGVFGNSPTANLAAKDYDNLASNGWVMYRREVTTSPSAYVKLLAATRIGAGAGYWLKSLSAPVGNRLEVTTGTATLVTVSQAQGCASANGCAAVPVQTVSGSNRYNLVGNPFPYAVDWSKVRVRVKNGETLVGVYTPSQAAGEGAGAANPAVMSKQIWIWNGTNNYDTWSDTDPNKGNLKYFQSFWINVLPGAAGLTVELLIPAEASALSQRAAPLDRLLAGLRAGAGWMLDALIPPAAADPGLTPGTAPGRERGPQPAPVAPVADPTLDLLITEGQRQRGLDPASARAAAHQTAAAEGREWRVRLKLDQPATGFKDHYNQLGQRLDAQNGYDPADLSEMAPFAAPWLTLVFPHPEWRARAGDYATDFRPAQRTNARGRPVAGLPAAQWNFEIRADRPGGEAVLTWEGPAAILQRSRLRDRDTGQTIQPSAPRYANGYRLTLSAKVRRLTWEFLGQ